MGAQRVVAALAAAAIPFLFGSWVELVSVDQPPQVNPGSSFSSTIEAVVHVGPIPLYDPLAGESGAASAEVGVSSEAPQAIRLGVLAPSTWMIEDLTWATAGSTGGRLEQAPTEAGIYENYYSAPPGYHWRAFSGDSLVPTEGTELTYQAQISTAHTAGVFRLVYMAWPDIDHTLDGGGLPVLPPDGLPRPYPVPSVIETELTVGTVGPAPRVTDWDPPDGAADVPIDADIRIGFSRDMDVDSLRDGGVLLYGGPVWYAQGVPAWADSSPLAPDYLPPPWPPFPVPALVFYNAQSRTAVIDPTEPLLPHTVYTAVVTASARAEDGVPVGRALVATFLTARAPESRPFSDVPPDHRFYTAIKALSDAGIIAGYPDGTFRPDSPVTRAHLAKLVVLLLGLHTPEPDRPPPFTDVQAAPGDPAAEYISEAAAAGITVGFDDGTFRPLDTVTRIQLVRMIVRAAQAWLTTPPPGFSAGFGDVDLADQGFVNWAAYNHLVDGKAPGRFDPWSTATRGHAARILYGVWQLIQQPVPAVESNGGAG